MDNIVMGSQPKSHGALIGSIIIVVILIIGAIYYFNTAKMQIEKDQAAAAQSAMEADAQVSKLNTQSNSDDIASIDADLQATNVDSLATQ